MVVETLGSWHENLSVCPCLDMWEPSLLLFDGAPCPACLVSDDMGNCPRGAVDAIVGRRSMVFALCDGSGNQGVRIGEDDRCLL